MQQIQTTAWSESAVHAFADLGLLSCQTVNCFIYQKRSKCSRFKPQRGLNLLYMLSLILDCWAVRPLIISSTKSAANAADSNHSRSLRVSHVTTVWPPPTAPEWKGIFCCRSLRGMINFQGSKQVGPKVSRNRLKTEPSTAQVASH